MAPSNSSNAGPSHASVSSNSILLSSQTTKVNSQDEDFVLFKNIKAIECWSVYEDAWKSIANYDLDNTQLLGRLTKTQLQFKLTDNAKNTSNTSDDSVTQRLTWGIEDIMGCLALSTNSRTMKTYVESFPFFHILFKKPGRTSFDTRGKTDQDPLAKIYQHFKNFQKRKSPMWLRVSFHTDFPVSGFDKLCSLGLRNLPPEKLPQTFGSTQNDPCQKFVGSQKNKKELTKSVPTFPKDIPVNPAAFRDDSIPVTFEYWSHVDQNWVLLPNCQTKELRLTARFTQIMLSVSAYQEPLIMENFPTGNSQGLKNLKEARDRAQQIATWLLHWNFNDIVGYILNKSSTHMDYHFLLKNSGELSAMGDDSLVLNTNRTRFDNNTIKLETMYDLIKDEFSSSTEKVPAVWIRLQSTKLVSKQLPFFHDLTKLKNISGRERAMLAFKRKDNNTIANQLKESDEASVVQSVTPIALEADGGISTANENKHSKASPSTPHSTSEQLEVNELADKDLFGIFLKDTSKDEDGQQPGIDFLKIITEHKKAKPGNTLQRKIEGFQSEEANRQREIRKEAHHKLDLERKEDVEPANNIPYWEQGSAWEYGPTRKFKANGIEPQRWYDDEDGMELAMKRSVQEDYNEEVLQQALIESVKEANHHPTTLTPGNFDPKIEADIVESENIIFAHNSLGDWTLPSKSDGKEKSPLRNVGSSRALMDKTLESCSKNSILQDQQTQNIRMVHNEPHKVDADGSEKDEPKLIDLAEASIGTDTNQNVESMGKWTTMLLPASTNTSLLPISESQNEQRMRRARRDDKANSNIKYLLALHTMVDDNQVTLTDMLRPVAAGADESGNLSHLPEFISAEPGLPGFEEFSPIDTNFKKGKTPKMTVAGKASNSFDLIDLDDDQSINLQCVQPIRPAIRTVYAPEQQVLAKEQRGKSGQDKNVESSLDAARGQTISGASTNQAANLLEKHVKYNAEKVEEQIPQTDYPDFILDDSNNNGRLPKDWPAQSPTSNKSDASSARTIKKPTVQKTDLASPQVGRRNSYTTPVEYQDSISTESIERSRESRSSSIQPELTENPFLGDAKSSAAFPHVDFLRSNSIGLNPTTQSTLQDTVDSMQIILDQSGCSSTAALQHQTVQLEMQRQRHLHAAAIYEAEISRLFEIQRQRHMQAAATYDAELARFRGRMVSGLIWQSINHYPQNFPGFP